MKTNLLTRKKSVRRVKTLWMETILVSPERTAAGEDVARGIPGGALPPKIERPSLTQT